MIKNVPKECKLNKFVPVKVPKTRDVFRRRGFQRSVDSSVSLASRNPLADFDDQSNKMNEEYYQQYVRMMSEKEKEKDEEVSDDKGEDDKK